MVAHRVEVSGEAPHTVPNVAFRVMGQGLVKSVEARTGEWVVWTEHVRKRTHTHTPSHTETRTVIVFELKQSHFEMDYPVASKTCPLVDTFLSK